jgi:hypothetical protein
MDHAHVSNLPHLYFSRSPQSLQSILSQCFIKDIIISILLPSQITILINLSFLIRFTQIMQLTQHH